MSEGDALLQGLIEEATALLSNNRKNLEHLLTRLDRYFEAESHTKQNGHQSPQAGLQYLHQQTDLLLSQNQTLTALLKSNLQGMLPVNYPLSGIALLQRQEEERAKTAKDLEDTSAQLLANAIFELAAVKRLITDKSNFSLVVEGLTALQHELEQGLTDHRLLIADLEPNTVLGNFGLVAGLRRYLEKFRDNTGISTELQVQTLIEPLPNIIETAIFRVIQEALQNIRRHAQAGKITLTIAEEDEHLQFSVLDNGIGMSGNLNTGNQRRLGLVSSKEIANLLHGTLTIKSEENKGTRVTLTIPYPKF